MIRTAIAQAGDLSSRFLAWWLDELGNAVPGPVRRAFAGGAGVISFRVVGTEMLVARSQDGESLEVARVDITRPTGEIRDEVASLLRAYARRTDDILLQLEPRQALRKTLDLPQAAEEGLDELLGFELDRQTPYRPEQARYDYRVAERDGASRRIKVELLVVPRDAAERLESIVADWGLEPTIVSVAEIDDPANPAFDLSGERYTADSGSGRTAMVLMVLLTIGILGAAVWFPLEAQRQAARDAEAILEDARKAAFAAADLRDELERRASAGSFLVRRKNESPMMTAVLADLTRLLPDDTWLFELHVRGREVRARGYAPAASNILELVERGPAFRNARFTSPVTRVPGIDAERFDLTFELADEGKDS